MVAVTKTQEHCSEYSVGEDIVKKANLRTTGHLKWHEQNVLNHSLQNYRWNLSILPATAHVHRKLYI